MVVVCIFIFWEISPNAEWMELTNKEIWLLNYYIRCHLQMRVCVLSNANTSCCFFHTNLNFSLILSFFAHQRMAVNFCHVVASDDYLGKQLFYSEREKKSQCRDSLPTVWRCFSGVLSLSVDRRPQGSDQRLVILVLTAGTRGFPRPPV